MSTLNTRALEQMVQDVHDGNENPLKAYGILKGLEEKIKKYLDEVKEPALTEADKHGKNFTEAGFIFERRAGRKIYSFKGIDEHEVAKNHLKSVEDKYKKLLDDGQTIDEDTGEVLVLPTITYGSDMLIVKNK